MNFLLTPTLYKTALAWVLLGALAMGHAQTNDQGTLDFSGTISKTTCVLNFGDAQSTLTGVKTLSFGSIPASIIPGGNFQGLNQIGSKTVILSVKNADGSTCDGILAQAQMCCWQATPQRLTPGSPKSWVFSLQPLEMPL